MEDYLWNNLIDVEIWLLSHRGTHRAGHPGNAAATSFVKEKKAGFTGVPAAPTPGLDSNKQ